MREPAEGQRKAPPSPNFVITSHSRSILGFLLAGLIEQRFPGCVCTIEGNEDTDLNRAGVRNPLNGNRLWVFAIPPAVKTLGVLRATANTSVIDLAASREEIDAALQKLVTGGVHFPSVFGKTGSALSLENLTPREREVAHLVAQGLANDEIAATMGLSTHTVRTHLSAIYQRLGIRSRGKLAARFRELKP
jgi:DNA-binding CsgD family transcriptional regulator